MRLILIPNPEHQWPHVHCPLSHQQRRQICTLVLVAISAVGYLGPTCTKEVLLCVNGWPRDLVRDLVHYQDYDSVLGQRGK